MDAHASNQCLKAYYAPCQDKIHQRFTVADVGSLLQGRTLHEHFEVITKLFGAMEGYCVQNKSECYSLSSLNAEKEKEKEPSTMAAEEKDTVLVHELDTTCVICFELWDEAFHTMACGAIICVKCYKTIHNATCPSCRTGLAEGSHILQPNIKKIMNGHREKMIVKCSNEKCEVRLTLKQMHHHQEHECQYTSILCEDCSYLVTRELYQQHLENECELRNVKCMLCNLEVVCNKMDAHIEKDCPSAQIVCKKCDASVIRKNELLHLEQDCPKHPVACNLSCGTIMRRELLAEHYNKCDLRKVECDHCHLAMLYNQLGSHLDVCLKRPSVCDSCNKRFPRQWQIRHARNECPHRWQHCQKSATCHHWHKASSQKFKFHVHDVCPTPFDPHMRLQTGMIIDLFNTTSHSKLWQTILVLDSRKEEDKKDEDTDRYTIRYKVYVNKTDVNAQTGTTSLERKSQLIAPAWSVNVFESYINVPIAALQYKRTFCGSILLGESGSPPCVVGDVHLSGKNWRHCYAIFADKSNTKLELGGCENMTSWNNTDTRMTYTVVCKVLYYFEFILVVNYENVVFFIPRDHPDLLSLESTSQLKPDNIYLVIEAPTRRLVRFLHMRSAVSPDQMMQVMMCFREIETFDDVSKPSLEPNVVVSITNTYADIWPLTFGVRDVFDLSPKQPDHD